MDKDIAVSYTHLDVYKRQVIESDELEEDKKICNEIPNIRKYMKNIKSE